MHKLWLKIIGFGKIKLVRHCDAIQTVVERCNIEQDRNKFHATKTLENICKISVVV